MSSQEVSLNDVGNMQHATCTETRRCEYTRLMFVRSDIVCDADKDSITPHNQDIITIIS